MLTPKIAAYCNVHLVSDSTGETLAGVMRACCAQFDNILPIEHSYYLVRSTRQLERVLREIENAPGVVMFTLSNDEMRERLEVRCKELGMACVAVLDPVLDSLSRYLGQELNHRIGAGRVLDADYFRRIDALNYAMAHDDGQLQREFTDSDVDQATVEASKIVYLEGYLFDAEAARRAFAKAAGLARASGRMIAITLSDSFVVERHREALLGFLETQVDLVFANETEITALFETEDFDAAVGMLRDKVKIAAVTRGAKGSVVSAGGETYAIGAFPVEKVVDTTGAGDQYAAGFMFGLATGRPLNVCGQLGSLAAAEVISHYGPRPQVSLKDLAASKGL